MSADDGYQATCNCGWVSLVFVACEMAQRALDAHRCEQQVAS